MPPIVRHSPGDRAPSAGTYALVGHFGEATSFAEWFEQGERFPSPTLVSDIDIGPLWFVKVYEAQQAARVA
jgi:hypothetical protein